MGLLLLLALLVSGIALVVYLVFCMCMEAGIAQGIGK